MYTIIVVQHYAYEILTITEVSELKECLHQLDNPNALVIMIHPNYYGEMYYTDLRTLMLELSPKELPTTLEELSAQLTDQQFDGYRVANPIKSYGARLVSYTIPELTDFKVELVNIETPYTRGSLYEGQERFTDIVITPLTEGVTVNGLGFIKDGRYISGTIFNGELYIEDVAIGLTQTNHLIVDMEQVGGSKFYKMNELTITSYEEGYTTVKLTGSDYFTSVPWIIIEGILYDLPNPHLIITGPQTLKINHDFPHIETPGMRSLHSDVSDEDYPAYRINTALAHKDSVLLVPYETVYVMKYRPTKIDDVTYMYKSLDPHIAGICMVAWQNAIVPMKVVSSKKHPVTGYYTHIIKIEKANTSLAMDEVMLNPDNVYTLNEPYNLNSRLDVRLISATT